jgi:hypothetical protein
MTLTASGIFCGSPMKFTYEISSGCRPGINAIVLYMNEVISLPGSVTMTPQWHAFIKSFDLAGPLVCKLITVSNELVGLFWEPLQIHPSFPQQTVVGNRWVISVSTRSAWIVQGQDRVRSIGCDRLSSSIRLESNLGFRDREGAVRRVMVQGEGASESRLGRMSIVLVGGCNLTGSSARDQM